MNQCDYITIRYGGRLYRIKKAPYETTCKTFERGWTIVKETHHTKSDHMNDEFVNACVNRSYETVFKKNGVEYEYNY